MKKLILILCILFCVTQAGNSPPIKTLIIARDEPINPYERLFEAICMVESHNNPGAFNKKERATGIVQIRPIRLKDYDKRTGKSYTLHDCFDKKISREVFLFYAQKYPASQLSRIAKRWNGSGRKTENYWKRVKSNLK